MTTRLISACLLALVGAPAMLSAQVRERRSAPESDDARRSTRIFTTRLPADANRPTLGIAVEAGSAADTLGVLVASVTPGGAADKAGVKEGDRLVAIDDTNLRLDSADAADPSMRGIATRRLTRELARHEIGDTVRLRLVRDGRTQTVSVKTEAPARRASTVAWSRGARENGDRASIGVSLGGSGSARDTIGVFVSAVTRGGPAEQAGIFEGDRIAAINGVDLRVAREDVEDWAASSAMVQRLSRELQRVKAGDAVTLKVVRAGTTRTVSVSTVAARELQRSTGYSLFVGDADDLGRFPMLASGIAPVPPVPPAAPSAPPAPVAPTLRHLHERPPLPPEPPLPPNAPEPPGAPRTMEWFFRDGDDEGPMRLRLSRPLRDELRLRAEGALDGILELLPREGRVRVEM